MGIFNKTMLLIKDFCKINILGFQMIWVVTNLPKSSAKKKMIWGRSSAWHTFWLKPMIIRKLHRNISILNTRYSWGKKKTGWELSSSRERSTLCCCYKNVQDKFNRDKKTGGHNHKSARPKKIVNLNQNWRMILRRTIRLGASTYDVRFLDRYR